jgi:hypothetical protein
MYHIISRKHALHFSFEIRRPCLQLQTALERLPCCHFSSEYLIMMELSIPTSDSASDLADFLQSILRKENRSAYKLRDYLGLKAPAPDMLTMWQQPQPDPSRCLRSVSPYSMKRRRLGEWEMTAQCRWQIGQWFFKSKLSAKHAKNPRA